MKIDFTDVLNILNQLSTDTTMPKNIRKEASDIINLLGDDKTAMDMRVSTAMMKLEEISDDINMPTHGRTLVWNAISQMENVMQKL